MFWQVRVSQLQESRVNDNIETTKQNKTVLVFNNIYSIHGSQQDCDNSIANTLGLPQSCAQASVYWMFNLSCRTDLLTVERYQILDQNDTFEREPFAAKVTSKESGNRDLGLKLVKNICWYF